MTILEAIGSVSEYCDALGWEISLKEYVNANADYLSGLRILIVILFGHRASSK
jgi:hypothetical protein